MGGFEKMPALDTNVFSKEKLTIEGNLERIKSLELLFETKKIFSIAKDILSTYKGDPEIPVTMIGGDLTTEQEGRNVTVLPLFSNLIFGEWASQEKWNIVGNLIYDLDNSVMLAKSPSHELLTMEEARLQLIDLADKVINY